MSQPSKPLAPERDPVPSLATEVIALFEDALSGVRFPDLDHQRLAQLAADARAAQLDLERLEAELLPAQARVAEQVAALLASAERGLAYARVFVQGDDALSARVAQLGGKPAGATRREEPAKRRPRKQRSSGAALFGDEAKPAADDAPDQDGVAA